jgi:hypothetical protein
MCPYFSYMYIYICVCVCVCVCVKCLSVSFGVAVSVLGHDFLLIHRPSFDSVIPSILYFHLHLCYRLDTESVAK